MNVLADRWFRNRNDRNHKGQALAKSRRAKLSLESLEDRAVPAVFIVNSLADTLTPPAGITTLRSAVQQANNTPGGNTIDLAIAGTYKIAIPGANTGTNASGAFAILPNGGNLTIQNTSRGAVTIDAGFLDRAFDINPTAQTATPFLVTIQGLTIENGDASPNDGAAGSGGGIRDQGSASLTLINDTITNCFATADGGGVSMENTVNNPWHLTIQNSNIINCHAGDAGGGVEEDGQGLVTITNSNISNDTTVNQGAGLWLDAINNVTANTTLTGDTFDNTVAFNGPTGAIGNAGNASVVINGCVVENNFVGGTAQGGAGFGDQNGMGNLAITNSLFTNNIAVTNGGAIYAGNVGTTTTITNTLIQNNAAQSGGGIEDPGSALTLTRDTIDHNHAVASNGGNGGNGGGLDVTDAAGNGGVMVTVQNSLFTNNTAVNAPSPGGGPEGLLSGSSSSSGSTINGDGGGISQVVGDLTVQNSQFSNNLASIDGGAILFLGRTFTSTGVTYDNNRATTDAGGALGLMPTGRAANGQGSSITNNTIVGNATSLAGGGIVDVGPGDLALLYDTINNNTAVTEGGGLAFISFSGTPILSVQNTIIAGNTAGTGPDVFTMGVNITDLGGNVVPTAGQGNTGFGAGTIKTNPKLSTLQNNGGQVAGVNPFAGYGGFRQVVQTEALLTGSSAINNAVKVALPNVDERGFPRPGKVFGNPSSGAFEPQFVGAPSVDFVIGADNQLYGRHTDTSGNPTGGYFQVAPGGVSAVQTARLGDTGVEVFVIGLDKQVYAATIDASGNVNGYFAVAPGQVNSIRVANTPSGAPELFVVGMDNQVYVLKFDTTGNPIGGYTPAAPGQVDGIAVGNDASGNPELFSIGTDHQVYAQKFDATGAPIGGYFATSPGSVSTISVVSDSSGHPMLFAVGLGTDTSVYSETFDATGTKAGGYTKVSSVGAVKSIAVGNDAAGNPELFAVEADSQVYAQTYTSADLPNGPAVLTTPGKVASIAVGADAIDQPEVFAILPDGQVYVETFDTNGKSTSAYTLYSNGQVKAMSVK